MINYIKKNVFLLIGFLIGSVAGYLYWKFIGCTTGTCPITNSPINNTIYGAIMGTLIGYTLHKDKKQNA